MYEEWPVGFDLSEQLRTNCKSQCRSLEADFKGFEDSESVTIALYWDYDFTLQR